MKLSVIIPAYNEETTLHEIISRVKAAPLSINKEIIVVDNGSIDKTREILKSESDIKVISLMPNVCKGGALKAGIKEATGDIVIFQDADLEYDPKDFQAVIDPILQGKTNVTNGVRMEGRLQEGNRLSVGIMGWLGNTAITWTTNILYLHYSKEYEGCYKAFRSGLLKSIHINTNDFDFDNELICKILKKGERVIDVPIHYHPRGYAQGKKINWKHGFKILWAIVKYRFIT